MGLLVSRLDPKDSDTKLKIKLSTCLKERRRFAIKRKEKMIKETHHMTITGVVMEISTPNNSRGI